MELNHHPELNLYLSVCSISCTLNAVVKEQLNKRLKPYGLQFQHWQALKALYFQEASSPSQLADKMHIQKPIATRLIDHLEMHELIERTLDSTDRRKYNLQLTQKGHQMAEKGFKAFNDLPNILTAAMHDHDNATTDFSEGKFVINVT